MDIPGWSCPENRSQGMARMAESDPNTPICMQLAIELRWTGSWRLCAEL
jgi:hypothetical protein